MSTALLADAARTPATTVVAEFTRRSLRHSVRDAEALLMAVVLPVMIMLLFVVVFGGAVDIGQSYIDYIVPGVILLCAGFGSSSVAVYVATDTKTGVIDRFRTMPIAAYGVVIGHVVAGTLRNLVATGVVITVGLLLGFRPSAGPAGWVAAIGLIALFVLMMTWLFAAIGLVAGSPVAANGYGFILLFLPYLSSAFVPTHTLPDWLAPVAEHQPMTPVIESVRALLTGAPATAVGTALLWCVGLLVVAVAWSVTVFGRRRGRG